MANISNLTRRQQVLAKLMEVGDWVDGSKLATESVGGSEGLRRLRELIAEGYPIEKRRHPDLSRDIWQYRYREHGGTPVRISTAIVKTETGYTYIAARPETTLETPIAPLPESRFTRLPSKIEFGAVAVCPRCKAKTRRYNYPGLEGVRHKDPFRNKQACIGCNGFGIVPNKGPIPMTPPEGLA